MFTFLSFARIVLTCLALIWMPNFLLVSCLNFPSYFRFFRSMSEGTSFMSPSAWSRRFISWVFCCASHACFLNFPAGGCLHSAFCTSHAHENCQTTVYCGTFLASCQQCFLAYMRLCSYLLHLVPQLLIFISAFTFSWDFKMLLQLMCHLLALVLSRLQL